jgi:peptidoglycan hydrolase CwlO-like protein
LVLLFVSFIILQDDFDSTLTGMMGALAEIQRKGDNMLAGIRRQREVLDMLERKAEQAERRREQAEVLARQMENEKQNLEDKVLELKAEKDTLMGEMKEDEMIRLV